jgi:hypothetical protein
LRNTDLLLLQTSFICFENWIYQQSHFVGAWLLLLCTCFSLKLPTIICHQFPILPLETSTPKYLHKLTFLNTASDAKTLNLWSGGSKLLTEGQSWVYIVGTFIPTGILGVMMGSIPFLGFQSNSTDALAYSSYICTMSNTHCVLIMYLHQEQPFLMSIFAISWMCRDRSDGTGEEQSKVTQCKVTAKLNSIPAFLPFLEWVCRDRTHDTGKQRLLNASTQHSTKNALCIVQEGNWKIYYPWQELCYFHSIWIIVSLSELNREDGHPRQFQKFWWLPTLEFADFKQSVVYTRSFLKVLFEECHSKFLRWCFVVFCNMSTDTRNSLNSGQRTFPKDLPTNNLYLYHVKLLSMTT